MGIVMGKGSHSWGSLNISLTSVFGVKRTSTRSVVGTVSKAGSTSKLLDASGFDPMDVTRHVFDGRAMPFPCCSKKWRCLNIPSQLGSWGFLKMRVFVKDSLLLLVFVIIVARCFVDFVQDSYCQVV